MVSVIVPMGCLQSRKSIQGCTRVRESSRERCSSYRYRAKFESDAWKLHPLTCEEGYGQLMEFVVQFHDQGDIELQSGSGHVHFSMPEGPRDVRCRQVIEHNDFGR